MNKKYLNDPKVVEFLKTLKPVRYSNQRFDEQQQLACILSEIDGWKPGYSKEAWKMAGELIKNKT